MHVEEMLPHGGKRNLFLFQGTSGDTEFIYRNTFSGLTVSHVNEEGSVKEDVKRACGREEGCTAVAAAAIVF